MELDLSSLSSNQVYHLMTQSIVPRRKRLINPTFQT
jgi:hypothetical protein